MPGNENPRIRSFPQAMDAAVKDVVLKNREQIIRASVQSQKDADELVEINQRIEAIRQRDPELVGAWGLGCGAGCAISPEAIGRNPFGR